MNIPSRIYCIGIGGIGVSALARYYKTKGSVVSGSDGSESEVVRGLIAEGIQIGTGEPDASRITLDVDMVVYSPAIRPEHPELQKAGELGILCLSYPEALGKLTKEHFTVAVSGTHGKSTTTSMISLMLALCGMDPTVIVGTKLKEFGNTNCRVGEGKYSGLPLLGIEADEHFSSFLNYWPKVMVWTTIEGDHLDHYGTVEKIYETFAEYAGHLREDGLLIANGDDKGVNEVLSRVLNPLFQVIKYSKTDQTEDAERIRSVLQVPGEHNVENGLAALAVGRSLGLEDEAIFAALGQFKGTWRRFEVFDKETWTLLSDYGHHPTEVKVTVEAARSKWKDRKIALVFQPHQYHRTHALWKEFLEVLSKVPVNTLVITDIYDVAGREDLAVKAKVSGELLTQAVREQGGKAEYVPYGQVEQWVKSYTREESDPVVMIMGAGNIYDITVRLTQGEANGNIM